MIQLKIDHVNEYTEHGFIASDAVLADVVQSVLCHNVKVNENAIHFWAELE